MRCDFMKRMLPLYLVYLIIVTMIVTGVSFSKYGTLVDGTDSARVAKPVLRYVPQGATYNGVVVSGGLSFTNVKPGDVLIYNFKIENFEGEGLNKVMNEVLLKYNIEISVEPLDELPLQRTLTSASTYPSASPGWTILGMGENISHSYTLRIEWDAGVTGSEYSNKTQTIRITINAEQID